MSHDEQENPRRAELDSAVASYVDAERQGRAPDREELIAKHPGVAEELRSFFANHDRLQRITEPLGTPTGSQDSRDPDLTQAVAPPSEGSAVSSHGEAQQALGGRFVPPTSQELNALLPQLDIFELLGHGGMGAVFKGRQPSLDRLVAVKVLPPAVSAEPQFADRFAREARALAKLEHPNIVSVYDSGQQDGLYYFVMEYVDGSDLRRSTQDHMLAPAEVLVVVRQICDTLQYAHDEGVVHRDIKPENVLLDRKGHVKIADFGLAKLLRREPQERTLTDAGHVMGTPHYMAPEQMESPLDVDHRADIYSLGVVFYEMLTGELPLGRFAPPSNKVKVDARLDELVLRMLEKEPARRYQSAREVRTDIDTLTSRSGDGDIRRLIRLLIPPAIVVGSTLFGIVNRLLRPYFTLGRFHVDALIGCVLLMAASTILIIYNRRLASSSAHALFQLENLLLWSGFISGWSLLHGSFWNRFVALASLSWMASALLGSVVLLILQRHGR